MAVTRIKNNQITDSTITYAKIAPGTLVGTNFNENLTLNSNVTIVGNLSVSGNSSTLNSVNTFISDPIVVFNDGYTGSISNYNIGMLVNRNYASLAAYGSVQTAWVWVEADQAFEAIATTTSGNAFTTLTNSGFANVKAGNVTANSITLSTGTFTAPAGIQNTPIGNVTPHTGAFTSLSSSTQATFATAVATNFSTGNARITGGYADNYPIGANTAATGAFTTLTTSSTFISSGNIVAASGTSSSSTTTGALVVTGGTGISGATYIGGLIDVTGAATLRSTLDVTGVTKVNSNIVAASGTASTSTTTGALVVVGGAGVSGNATIGGSAVISGDAYVQGGDIFTSATTFNLINDTATTVNAFGAATTLNTGNSGGTTNMAGVVKVGGNLVATSGTTSTSTTTGALVVTGGTGISGALNVGGASALGSTLSVTDVSTLNGNVVAASGTASTSTVTGALVVTGGTGISGNLNIGGSAVIAGNLTVNGTYTYVNSTVTTHEDPILELNTGVNGAPLTGTAFDAGIKTHYYESSTDKSAFFGRTNDTGNFEYYAYVSGETGNVISGTYGTIKSGALTLANTTAATSVTSGALQVAGGAGITGDLFAYRVNSTFGNITTGYFGSLNTANAVVTGGYADNFPIGANVAVAGRFTTVVTTGVTTVAGNLVANSTTPSTSTTTGAVVITGTGGLGVGGNLNLGTNASLHNIKGNLLIGQGNIVDSADTILTINLNTDTPLVSNAVVHVSGLSGSNAFYGVDAVGTSAISGFVGRKSRGTSSAHSAVQAGDTLAIFTGKGYGATGYTPGIATGMFVQADQNFTDSAQGTRISFQTVANGDTAVRQVLQLSSNATVVVPVTTATTSTTSGALIVAGGAGIGGNVFVGGNTNIASTLTVGAISTLNGNVVAASGVESTDPTVGALVVSNSGGLGVTGNVFAGKSAVFNSTKTTGMDFIAKGANDDTLIWARPNSAYDSVVIGNSATATTAIKGAKLVINSTDSFLIPVGTNAQRPSSVFGSSSYDVQGMLRYNTTINGMELFNGTTWQAFTTTFTVIADTQFTGDGSTVAFTLPSAQTTASCIVSINGVLQAPTGLYGSAYSVSDTTLTFTEAPLSGDVIDVRMLTTTVTVTNLTSTNGYMAFSVDNYGANVYTGSSSPVLTSSWTPSGAQVGFLPNVSVASANTATTIDTIDTTQYRSAKYLIQVTNGAKYQVSEALVISNGTTATITTYGTLSTSGNLGVLTATQSGSSALVQFIATNATNNVRITKDYLAI